MHPLDLEFALAPTFLFIFLFKYYFHFCMFANFFFSPHIFFCCKYIIECANLIGFSPFRLLPAVFVVNW
jgi:hypothetical protein